MLLRRLIVVIALAAGLSIEAITLAVPALAKGPSQARITGQGLARAIVVSGNGEPGQLSRLATLASQTGLFNALFGAGGTLPTLAPLRTAPTPASLGPRYVVTYTVPGVPSPSHRFGRIRQDVYPRAADGPVIYTPPGQRGFGGPLQVAGWLKARPRLTKILAALGVPPRTVQRPARRTGQSRPAAAHRPGAQNLAWLIASIVAVAAAALTATALWLRRRKPAIVRSSS